MSKTIFDSLIVYNNEYDIDLSNKTGNICIIQDSLSNENMFNNLLKYEKNLKDNTYKKIVNHEYKFRPDKLALEIYGNQLLYPLILIANNLTSILQFDPKKLNFTIKIPNNEIVQKILIELKTN